MEKRYIEDMSAEDIRKYLDEMDKPTEEPTDDAPQDVPIEEKPTEEAAAKEASTEETSETVESEEPKTETETEDAKPDEGPEAELEVEDVKTEEDKADNTADVLAALTARLESSESAAQDRMTAIEEKLEALTQALENAPFGNKSPEPNKSGNDEQNDDMRIMRNYNPKYRG